MDNDPDVRGGTILVCRFHVRAIDEENLSALLGNGIIRPVGCINQGTSVYRIGRDGVGVPG